MTRVGGLAAALVVFAALAACSGNAATRRDVVDGYRRELVRTGVHEAQAR